MIHPSINDLVVEVLIPEEVIERGGVGLFIFFMIVCKIYIKLVPCMYKVKFFNEVFDFITMRGVPNKVSVDVT